jgi:hypothetical protein
VKEGSELEPNIDVGCKAYAFHGGLFFLKC